MTEPTIPFAPELDPEELLRGAIERKKVQKINALKRLTITINSVEFDANDQGLVNMSSVGTIANWQFNLQMINYLKSISNPSTELQGFTQVFENTYNGLYKLNTVDWKSTDNTLHTLSIETVLIALHQSMTKKGQILAESII